MIKINIHIEADSVEEARSAFAQLGSAPVESLTGNAPISGETSSPAPVEKPKTRGSKTASAEPAKQEATVVQMTTADPMGVTQMAAADPLATTIPPRWSVRRRSRFRQAPPSRLP